MERQRADGAPDKRHSDAFLGMGAAMHEAGANAGWASRRAGRRGWRSWWRRAVQR
jgi:hypothetical protein